MSCARAFGALIDMRDEPANAEIPESFKASTYHTERIEKDRAELAELLAMNPDSAAEKARDAHEKSVAYHTEAIEERNELKSKYEAMLAEVANYASPSPDHDNLKEFMANQIKDSIKFDCGGDYHERAIAEAVALSGPEWIAAEKKRLEESIEYHLKHHQDEIKRVSDRNEWVQKLLESLN